MHSHLKWRYAVTVCFLALSSLGADDPKTPAAYSPHLLMRHPHAKVLLQEVTLPADKMSLLQFQKFLDAKFGLKVTIDEEALEEESIPLDEMQPVPPLKNVLLLNALHEYLNQMACTIVEEPHRVLITTKTVGITVRPRVLFQVQDLVSADPKFDLADMHDPIFDRNEAFRLRIEAKLKTLVTWQLKDASINDVIKKLRTELAENVTIDAAKLDEESISLTKEDISCDYRNLPLGDILQWVLRSEALCYYIRRESIAITTLTEGITISPIRSYPVRDLLFRDVHPERAEFVPVTPQWNGPGLGWLGGYGSGYFALGNPDPFSKIGPVAQVGGRYYRMRQAQARAAANEQAFGDSLSAGDAARFTQDNANALLNDIVLHTGGSPDHPWCYFIDGEGAALGMYYPSFSLVVRNDEHVHAEISEYLSQMRTLQTQRGTNPEVIGLTTKDATARPEKAGLGLITLLEELAGGPPDSPWTSPAEIGEKRGEGGTISYDKTHFALTIRQTTHALDEIAGLLIQLRRDRYQLFHGTAPPEAGAAVNRLPMPAR